MDEITDRFITVYKTLISEGKVKNLSDFAKKIGVSTSLINEIDKKRSNVGLVAIQNTVMAFKINPTWILTGSGELYNEKNIIEVETNNETPEKISTLYKTIGRLEYQVELLKEENNKLKLEIESLKKETNKNHNCISKRS